MFKLGIFEDERIILDSLCHYMNWKEYGCQLACSSFRGRDVADLIRIHQPDIVITDIKMGDINGLDICELLQKEYPHTQKIIITGYGSIAYAKRAIKASVVDFILKPIDRDELIQAVKKAARQLSLLHDFHTMPAIGAHPLVQPMVCRIRQYIEKNYSLPLSVKVIAAEFHYNPKYLSALVKKEAGTSINDMILKTRIEKAMELMKNPVLKTGKIAELVGIPNARYFSQIFKKITGKTPKDYRTYIKTWPL